MKLAILLSQIGEIVFAEDFNIYVEWSTFPNFYFLVIIIMEEVKDPQNHSDSNDNLIKSSDSQHPANLIPELCRKFWTLGWVTGTGGGTSIRDE